MKPICLFPFISNIDFFAVNLPRINFAELLFLIARYQGVVGGSGTKTWLWLAATGLAALLCMWITRRILRKEHQRQLDQLRTQLSADLHDDVGALLAGLAMQAEILAVQASAAQREKWDRLAGMSRRAQANLRDIVWGYDARKDNWQSLMDRLRDYAEEALAPAGIRFEMKLESIRLDQTISPALRKELYLIGKEAIANVVRHSNASRVVFQLRREKDQFELDIQDDGKISPNAVMISSGLGMSNIQMRAQRLSARMNVSLRQGFGIHLRMRATA